MNLPDLVWQPPPPAPVLARAEVHVWRASLELAEATWQCLFGLLSADERRRAERFYFEKHRRRFVASRALLRKVLGRYLGRDPAGLTFRYGLHGKPALAAPGGAETIDFNLTHSDERALLGVTRGRDIGVDLERLRPLANFEALARRFFAPGEAAALAEVPLPRKQEAFFNCWTRKEAFIKACGKGLAQPLDRFEVTLRPGEPARLLHIDGSAEAARAWSLQALTPCAGYTACVAVRGHGGRLCAWDWTEGEWRRKIPEIL